MALFLTDALELSSLNAYSRSFNFFAIRELNSIILRLLGRMKFFVAISCFITGFIAYSKARMSLRRDNDSTKRSFDRVTLEETRRRVFQKR